MLDPQIHALLNDLFSHFGTGQYKHCIRFFRDGFQIAIFGLSLSRTLDLSISVAWDVYLLYAPDHSWEAEFPPSPEFWMHQQDEEMSLYLDPVRLKQQVKALIERIASND